MKRAVMVVCDGLRADMVTPEEAADKVKALKKANKNVVAISVIDDESMKKVKEILNAIAKERSAP